MATTKRARRRPRPDIRLHRSRRPRAAGRPPGNPCPAAGSILSAAVFTIEDLAARGALFGGMFARSLLMEVLRPEPEPTRDRVLTDHEIVMIWNACHDAVYGKIVRLLILTGQRRQEVGAITAEEIDLERRTWMLPASRTKNHQQHAVPLSDQALAILRSAIAGKPQGWLFGFNGFQGWSESRAALDKRTAQTPAPWVLHDIR